MTRLILIIAFTFVAANCGQKGPLEPPSASAVLDAPGYVLDPRD